MALNTTPYIVQASAAKTTTGQTAAASALLSNLSEYRQNTISIFANVTAVTGTSPSMTLTVQWSTDGATWFDDDPVDTFTAITAAATKVKQFAVKGTQFRVVYTITGTTPSFTFALTATGA